MKVATKPPSDWNAPREGARQPGYLAQRTLAIALAAAAAVILTLLLGPIVGLGVVIVIDVLVAVGLLMWASNQGLLALRSTGAKAAREEDEPRLWNVAAGLASDLGVPRPAIYIVAAGGPNALACRTRGPAVAVTRSLLDSYTRTELEATVAHCLVRLKASDIERAALGIALGRLGTRAIPRVGTADDIRAAATTRFPPALISAIEKAEARGGRYGPFWFVGDGPAHRSVDERIATLQDL